MPVNEDEKFRVSDEICGMIHSAADVARQAVMSEDATVKKALQTAAKALLNQAIRKIDESVGTSVADEEDDE